MSKRVGYCTRCNRRRTLVPDEELCSECNMAHLGPIADAIRNFRKSGGENETASDLHSLESRDRSGSV